MSTEYDYNEIIGLLVQFVENDIDDSQREKLLDWSRRDGRAVQVYSEFMKDYGVFIRQIPGYLGNDLKTSSSNAHFDQELWATLQVQEQNAPKFEVPEKTEERRVIQKVVYQQTPRKINRVSLVSAITSVAAIVLIVLFLRFAPSKAGVEVAVLADSLDAKWAAANDSMLVGTALLTASDPLQLQKGYAELLFDNDTRVTLVGPAEFQVLDDDQIKLNYGQVYCVVPHTAHGFQITTPHSKIIDLGTEFGVKQDLDGDCEVHVVKGKTFWVSRVGGVRAEFGLTAGSARKLDYSSERTIDIPYENELFVREFDSASGVIWQGQRQLDLADIVGGGSGFGGARVRYGASMNSGRIEEIPRRMEFSSKSTFVPVKNIFIDSVFIPNSQNGPVEVSTEGHIFETCPKTRNICMHGVSFEKAYALESGYTLSYNADIPDDRLAPVIWMHSNQGISFSLKNIQESCPEGTVGSCFTTEVCILADVMDMYNWRIKQGGAVPYPMVSVYVLIDGVPRFERLELKPEDGVVPIRVALEPDDNYLTLIVTDSGRTEYDWTAFVNPRIDLTPRSMNLFLEEQNY